MANNRFASVPNISIPRSRFKQPFNHSTTFNHGELVPVDCFDILPGDTYKIDLASMIWMSNPIRPIFGNITAHVDVFFVPMRLVWEYTQAFFGENKLNSGYQTINYTIPSVYFGYGVNNTPAWDSLSAYLGKPVVTPANASTYCKRVSILKERAYYEIWNNYYRSQQLQQPVIINYSGNGVGATIGTYKGNAKVIASKLMKVNKEFDYFTAATLYPQYGPAVTLPLGSYAPIITKDPSVNANLINNTYAMHLGGSFSSTAVNGNYTLSFNQANSGTAIKSDVKPITNSGSQIAATIYPDNLYADLSNATAATINSLRYAFAVQKYLERSNFGTRFFEMLSVHYGVTSPDATLQIPQRIGHADFPINVSTVLSTAGAAADTSTELGMPGATSCTTSNKYLCTHAFTEPGFLFVLLSTTHERSYSQGLLREDIKANRYEIYSPEFANLGDQEIKNCEIYYDPSQNLNDDVFGYQEHWAEYRYRPHRVSGLLNPAAANALDFWVLTDYYDDFISLDENWIEEDRDELSRCLVSGASGPDYIGDFYLPYVATREMPLFTIPGLIDHFGSM